jgi:hypothetical protein
LDREDIGNVAIETLRPLVCVSTGVDQLRVHAHFAAGALHTAFEQVRDAELLRDLAQVSHDSGFVLHD